MNCSAIACVAHDPSVDNSPAEHPHLQHSTHCPSGQSAHNKKPARNRCVAVPSRLVVCARWCPALPRPVGRSTMGAGVLSFRVRDGSGRVLPAMTTETFVWGVWCASPPGGCCRSTHWWGCPPVHGWWWWVVVSVGCLCVVVVCGCCCGGVCGWVGRGPYSGRGSGLCGGVGGVCCVGRLVPVSFDRYRSCTSGLSTQWSAGGLPHHGGVWRPGLEDGFPLRCFQRLSVSERG